MIFCLSGDFIFWVKSPLTNALLILDALALPGLHILLAQSAIKSGDLVCLYHIAPFPTADKHGFVLSVLYHTPLFLSLFVKF